jgi:hypothetical protein
MQPVASPRHPWKALFAVLAMFALVHGAGAGAHVFSHDADHGHTTITIGHAVSDDDGPDIDVRVVDDDPDDADPWDQPVTDAFDHDVD